MDDTCMNTTEAKDLAQVVALIPELSFSTRKGQMGRIAVLGGESRVLPWCGYYKHGLAETCPFSHIQARPTTLALPTMPPSPVSRSGPTCPSC
jgi:hypothetical protein